MTQSFLYTDVICLNSQTKNELVEKFLQTCAFFCTSCVVYHHLHQLFHPLLHPFHLGWHQRRNRCLEFHPLHYFHYCCWAHQPRHLPPNVGDSAWVDDGCSFLVGWQDPEDPVWDLLGSRGRKRSGGGMRREELTRVELKKKEFNWRQYFFTITWI